MRAAESSGREALWVIFLLGWLGAEAALALANPSLDLPHGVESAPVDPRSAPPRELRRLPGIGESRAIEVARARWRRGLGRPPLYLSDVPGIGTGTEERVRRWLDRRHDP